tara:strand:- start:7070 stop:7366 length:297 start_codon:yes stop_codon:yes gene_type:complete
MKNTKTLSKNKIEDLIRYLLDSKGYEDYQYTTNIHYNNVLDENYTMIDLLKYFGSLDKETQERVIDLFTKKINLEKASLYFTEEFIKYTYTNSVFAKK